VLIAAVAGLPLWGHGQEAGPLRLTLEESVALALEGNESLQMVRQDRRKAHQQIREARASALPQIDLSADYTRNWQLPTFVFETPAGRQQFKIGSRNEATSALSLRQPLYTSGKVGAAIEVAYRFEDFAAEKVRAGEQQVRSAVEIAFYDLLLARELVRVSDQALARTRAHLEQVESWWRGGRVSEYDLLRAQVQVSEARPDSIRARNGLALAALTFKNLIGVGLERRVEVEGGFRTRTELELDGVEGLVQLGLERRSELRQAQRQVEMLALAVRISQAGSRPSLEMSSRGQVQVQSDEFELWEEKARRSLNTGVSLKIPLFDGFRTGAQVEQARSDWERAQLALVQLRRGVELQIQQAWLELQAAGARLAARGDALGQAETGLGLATSRYARGAGTQLEIVDAQLTLTQAQAVALVQLETAVGVIGESAGRERKDE